jgi:hypothetical protein
MAMPNNPRSITIEEVAAKNAAPDRSHANLIAITVQAVSTRPEINSSGRFHFFVGGGSPMLTYWTNLQYRQDLQRECMAANLPPAMPDRRTDSTVCCRTGPSPGGDAPHQSMKMVAGCSSWSLSAWIIDAAS